MKKDRYLWIKRRKPTSPKVIQLKNNHYPKVLYGSQPLTRENILKFNINQSHLNNKTIASPCIRVNTKNLTTK